MTCTLCKDKGFLERPIKYAFGAVEVWDCPKCKPEPKEQESSSATTSTGSVSK